MAGFGELVSTLDDLMGDYDSARKSGAVQKLDGGWLARPCGSCSSRRLPW